MIQVSRSALKQFRAAFAGEKPRDLASSNAEILGVEGPHLVETALRAGIQVTAVLFSEAGAEYYVLTSKHHEGFCLFDSKLTSYCAPRQGPGRDLVREYADAARAEGLVIEYEYV